MPAPFLPDRGFRRFKSESYPDYPNFPSEETKPRGLGRGVGEATSNSSEVDLRGQLQHTRTADSRILGDIVAKSGCIRGRNRHRRTWTTCARRRSQVCRIVPLVKIRVIEDVKCLSTEL